MNFLAHLHLAHLADSSLLGNLLADFVRGNPRELYSLPVADGIMMHRRVDSLTDSLPVVRQCRQYFSPETKRVAPITLDVVWDHFLARHWQELDSTRSLPEFTQYARSHIEPYLAQTPASFQQMNQLLWDERWLERYADFTFIGRVLNGMAKRRPKLGALADSFSDIERHYHQLETHFWQFYPLMMQQAKAQEL